MHQDIIQTKWSQIKNPLQAQFSKLTDDDLARPNGDHQYVAGKLQERYGWQRDKAEQELRTFENTLNRSKAA